MGRNSKKQICIRLEPDDLNWIKEQMKIGKFSSISHAVQQGVKTLRKIQNWQRNDVRTIPVDKVVI